MKGIALDVPRGENDHQVETAVLLREQLYTMSSKSPSIRDPAPGPCGDHALIKSCLTPGEARSKSKEIKVRHFHRKTTWAYIDYIVPIFFLSGGTVSSLMIYVT